MHLRDGKLKTCNKLACMHVIGSGGSDGTQGHHQHISSKD